MTVFYEIEDQSKFHIKLKVVENIEEVVGEFLTKDEVEEMMGGERSHISTYSPIVKKTVVIDYLNKLIQKAKEQEKKTIIIDDEDLIEFLKKYNYCVSQFIEGSRRVGNRFFIPTENKKKEQNEPNKQNIQSLIDVGFRILSSKSGGVSFECKHAYENYKFAVDVIKKLVTLEEIVEYAEKCGYHEIHIPFFQMIWDDSEKYCPKKEKEQ